MSVLNVKVVRCPACSYIYPNLTIDQIPVDGKLVECPNCASRYMAQRSGDNQLVSLGKPRSRPRSNGGATQTGAPGTGQYPAVTPTPRPMTPALRPVTYTQPVGAPLAGQPMQTRPQTYGGVPQSPQGGQGYGQPAYQQPYAQQPYAQQPYPQQPVQQPYPFQPGAPYPPPSLPPATPFSGMTPRPSRLEVTWNTPGGQPAYPPGVPAPMQAAAAPTERPLAPQTPVAPFGQQPPARPMTASGRTAPPVPAIRLRTLEGHTYEVPDERTLVLWIIEHRIVERDQISLNGGPYNIIADTPDYKPFFRRLAELSTPAASVAGLSALSPESPVAVVSTPPPVRPGDGVPATVSSSPPISPAVAVQSVVVAAPEPVANPQPQSPGSPAPSSAAPPTFVPLNPATSEPSLTAPNTPLASTPALNPVAPTATANPGPRTGPMTGVALNPPAPVVAPGTAPSQAPVQPVAPASAAQTSEPSPSPSLTARPTTAQGAAAPTFDGSVLPPDIGGPRAALTRAQPQPSHAPAPQLTPPPKAQRRSNPSSHPTAQALPDLGAGPIEPGVFVTDPDLKAFEGRQTKAKSGRRLVSLFLLVSVLVIGAAVYKLRFSGLPQDVEAHVAELLEAVDGEKISRVAALTDTLDTELNRRPDSPRLMAALAYAELIDAEQRHRDADFMLLEAQRFRVAAESAKDPAERDALNNQADAFQQRATADGEAASRELKDALALAKKAYNRQADAFAHLVLAEAARIGDNPKQLDEMVAFIAKANKRDAHPALLKAAAGALSFPRAEASAKALESYLATHPNDPRGRYYLGLAYMTLNKLADARSAFARVLELSPGHPGAALRIESIDRAGGSFAAVAAEKAATGTATSTPAPTPTKPTEPPAPATETTAAKNGPPLTSIGKTKTAADVTPVNEAAQALTTAPGKTGDKAGDRNAPPASAARPKPEGYDKTIGEIRTNLKEGELKRAVLRASRMVRDYPDQPDAYVLMADILEARGDRVGAARALEDYVKRFPAAADAAKAQTRAATLRGAPKDTTPANTRK
jgi:TolA-binding protein